MNTTVQRYESATRTAQSALELAVSPRPGLSADGILLVVRHLNVAVGDFNRDRSEIAGLPPLPLFALSIGGLTKSRDSVLIYKGKF